MYHAYRAYFRVLKLPHTAVYIKSHQLTLHYKLITNITTIWLRQFTDTNKVARSIMLQRTEVEE